MPYSWLLIQFGHKHPSVCGIAKKWFMPILVELLRTTEGIAKKLGLSSPAMMTTITLSSVSGESGTTGLTIFEVELLLLSEDVQKRAVLWR